MNHNRRRYLVIVTYKSGRVERHHASGRRVRDMICEKLEKLPSVETVKVEDVKG